jgi:hypothetical protein
MTDAQHTENDEVLINPATGMPETRQERDQREQKLQERQAAVGREDKNDTAN